jgi:hypothetical protein
MEDRPGDGEADLPIDFDMEVALASFLQPQPAQETLRVLFDYARSTVFDALPDDEFAPSHAPERRTVSGSRSPRYGSIMQLNVQMHELPEADPVSGLRHVATLTSDEVVEGTFVTRTRELWWGPGGDYLEVRGDACSEDDAHALIQGMWPDIDD